MTVSLPPVDLILLKEIIVLQGLINEIQECAY